MLKIPKQMVTAEYKAAAIQQIKDGQSIAVVARELGMSKRRYATG